MNADELLERMNETLSLVKSLHAETLVLKEQVSDLQKKLAYRERVLTGWKEIAEYIDVDIATARRLNDLAFDPLPVWREGVKAVSLASALDAYRQRRRFTKKAVRMYPRENDEPKS